MNLFFTLNRLETHLQTLIEGSLARLFPSYDLRRELAQRLFNALSSEARPTPDGQVLAPDHYTVFLPSDLAAVLVSHPDLLTELAQDLILAADESEVHFQSPPTVRALPDPDASGQIMVLAEFSLSDTTGKTLGTTLLPPAAELPLPAVRLDPAESSAFLLLENRSIFPLETAVTNLGRSPENHLSSPDERLAPLHAQIRQTQGRYTLFNLVEPSLTTVNGRPVSFCELEPGDVISLGGVLLIFGQETPASDLDATQPIS